MPYELTSADIQALRQRAARLGVTPEELLGTIGMETGGSYDPAQWGGTGGKYMGIFQAGGPEREQFGVKPDQTFEEQLGPMEDFLTTRGYKSGMGLDQLYSTINAGSPGRMGASDRPGATVASHVADIRKNWVPRAKGILENFPEGPPRTQETYDPLSSIGEQTDPFKEIAQRPPMPPPPQPGLSSPSILSQMAKPPVKTAANNPMGILGALLSSMGGGEGQAPEPAPMPDIRTVGYSGAALPRPESNYYGMEQPSEEDELTKLRRRLGIG